MSSRLSGMNREEKAIMTYDDCILRDFVLCTYIYDVNGHIFVYWGILNIVMERCGNRQWKDNGLEL